jgi:hypothetical protein
MRLKQNHMERLQDLMQRGEITAEQANVEKVKMARVQMVISGLPADVRRALNAAVKRGELGHIKKDGAKPEVYFHPHFEHLAIGDRNRRARDVANSVIGICV